VHLTFWASSYNPTLDTKQLDVYKPTLHWLPFLELHVNKSDLTPVSALAEALGGTTRKLRVKSIFETPRSGLSPGNMSTVAGWLELLGALPHVGTLQVMLLCTFDDAAAPWPVDEQNHGIYSCWPCHTGLV
jgi:hypothetical protein